MSIVLTSLPFLDHPKLCYTWQRSLGHVNSIGWTWWCHVYCDVTGGLEATSHPNAHTCLVTTCRFKIQIFLQPQMTKIFIVVVSTPQPQILIFGTSKISKTLMLLVSFGDQVKSQIEIWTNFKMSKVLIILVYTISLFRHVSNTLGNVGGLIWRLFN